MVTASLPLTPRITAGSVRGSTVQEKQARNRKDRDTASKELHPNLEMRKQFRRRSNAEAQTWKERPRSLGSRARLHGNEFRLRSGQRQAGDDLCYPGSRR